MNNSAEGPWTNCHKPCVCALVYITVTDWLSERPANDYSALRCNMHPYTVRHHHCVRARDTKDRDITKGTERQTHN